ncbi:MAG: response regulator [Alphaproteobacteria bacterium]|nr:response regulator [Alphaproteobacteria bacterium]
MADILLAEDDASMLEFLKHALANAGHSVLACNNGLEALDLLIQGKSFDLLLTDIVMPGMDGVELAQKASDICPDMKVMFITGFAAVAMANTAEVSNTNTKVLSKPFHLNDLVDQVNTLLSAA